MRRHLSLEHPRVSFYFRFYGDSFDPAEITRRLGVEPTDQFRSGDPIRLRTVSRSCDGWIIEVAPREVIEIHDMLHELQKRVDVSSSSVKRTCLELGLEAVIECAVLQPISATVPDLDFPDDFLMWSASMGASINIDFILTESSE